MVPEHIQQRPEGQKGGNMGIAAFNRRETRFKVDTTGFVFKKLNDLFEENKPETVYSVYGLYINRKSKFGDSPFAASDGCFISLPNHMVDQVKDILKDSESIDQMNEGKAGLVIRPYVDDKGITHYSADFVETA